MTARLAGRRLGDEPADLPRRRRIGDVEHAEPAGEPGAIEPVAADALLELMRAEAPGGAEGAVELAQMEHAERADIAQILDIEEP